jgi:hypothetical protein
MVLPGNKKFVEGDVLPRSGEGRGRKASDPGEGDSEDAFRFVLSRDEFVDLFLDDLELPDLAKRKLAEAESEGLRRAGYSTSGSPANISVSRTVQLAMARHAANQRLIEVERLSHDCILSEDTLQAINGPVTAGRQRASGLRLPTRAFKRSSRPSSCSDSSRKASGPPICASILPPCPAAIRQRSPRAQ